MSFLRHRPSTIMPDIQILGDDNTKNIFQQLLRQLQSQAANIYDDLVNVDSRTSGVVYFGDPDTNGTWRIITSGANLAVQIRTAGVWVEKALWVA